MSKLPWSLWGQGSWRGDPWAVAASTPLRQWVTFPLLHFKQGTNEGLTQQLWGMPISGRDTVLKHCFVMISFGAEGPIKKKNWLQQKCLSSLKEDWVDTIPSTLMSTEQSLHPCPEHSEVSVTAPDVSWFLKNRGCFLHFPFNSEIFEWTKPK